MQLRSGCCESSGLSCFGGERGFTVNSVVFSGWIVEKVGGLAAGRTLKVSPPCARCDRHPPSLLFQVSPPSFPCPDLLLTPFQGRRIQFLALGRCVAAGKKYSFIQENGRTLRQSDATQRRNTLRMRRNSVCDDKNTPTTYNSTNKLH